MSPLAKKLLIKPGQNWLLFNAPANYLALLEPLPDGVTTSFEAKGTFDGIQLFTKNSTELAEGLKIIVPVLKPNTIFWIAYPKKSSGIESDLAMMGEWKQATVYGLEPVAAIAVDETWTASRFRPIGQAKVSNVGADEIRQNEYGQWIDVDKKAITCATILSRPWNKTRRPLPIMRNSPGLTEKNMCFGYSPPNKKRHGKNGWQK